MRDVFLGCKWVTLLQKVHWIFRKLHLCGHTDIFTFQCTQCKKKLDFFILPSNPAGYVSRTHTSNSTKKMHWIVQKLQLCVPTGTFSLCSVLCAKKVGFFYFVADNFRPCGMCFYDICEQLAHMPWSLASRRAQRVGVSDSSRNRSASDAGRP